LFFYGTDKNITMMELLKHFLTHYFVVGLLELYWTWSKLFTWFILCYLLQITKTTMQSQKVYKIKL